MPGLRIIAIIGLALFSHASFSQAMLIDAIPAPTAIRTYLKGTSIVITWNDVPGKKMQYGVYRSEEAIAQGNISSVPAIAIVEAGEQFYVDKAPNVGQNYYCVLALGHLQMPYKKVIPGENASVQSIAFYATNAPTGIRSAIVTQLSASINARSVVLNYLCPTSVRLYVYRNLKPVRTEADLVTAKLVANYVNETSNVIDNPPPGEYWYAILTEESLLSGKIDLVTGSNSLADSIKVGDVNTVATASNSIRQRTAPLPYLTSLGDFNSQRAFGSASPERKTLSPETEQLIAMLMKRMVEVEIRPPEQILLPAIPDSKITGEDYVLEKVVNETVARRNWQLAISQLGDFLSVNHSPVTGARAHFSMGVALAMMGRFRESFFEFLEAQNYYPEYVRNWLDYDLAMLRQSNQYSQ